MSETEKQNDPATDPKADDQPKPMPRGKKAPAVGPGNEPAAPISPSQAVKAGESTVEMDFKRSVILTDDAHRRIRFPAGRVAVPAHLADHWYLKANGATKV